MIVEDTHKIIFCSIPKVASSTWKRVLVDLQGLKQGIYVHQARLWRRLGEYSEEGQSHRLKTISSLCLFGSHYIGSFLVKIFEK